MQVVTTYKEFAGGESVKSLAREFARSVIIAGLSIKRGIKGNNWIKLPYYHHVFDDDNSMQEAHCIYCGAPGIFNRELLEWEIQHSPDCPVTAWHRAKEE